MGVKTFELARSLRFHRDAFVPAPAARYFRLCEKSSFHPSPRDTSLPTCQPVRLRHDTFIFAEKSSFHPSRHVTSLPRSYRSRACGKIFSSLPKTFVQIYIRTSNCAMNFVRARLR
jgi:hypothetical protein